MKLYLSINPGNQEDLDEAKRLVKFRDYSIVLCDIAGELRSRIKYSELGDEKLTLDNFSDWFWQLMREYEIDPFND